MVAGSAPGKSRSKLLRSTYLADAEGLLRETRGTGLFYFPGPVFWLFVFTILDYSVFALRFGLPAFPTLTNFFGGLGPIGSTPSGSYLTILFGLITLVLLLWLLVRYLRWISTVYAVTTHRVIIQRGIISRDFDQIPIPQVRGVDVHQTIGQRMLGYGTVTVSSEGGSTIGNEAWKGIPKPFEFQRLIENANVNISAQVGSFGAAGRGGGSR